jgi:hypothetical protein
VAEDGADVDACFKDLPLQSPRDVFAFEVGDAEEEEHHVEHGDVIRIHKEGDSREGEQLALARRETVPFAPRLALGRRELAGLYLPHVHALAEDHRLRGRQRVNKLSAQDQPFFWQCRPANSGRVQQAQRVGGKGQTDIC